MGSVRRFDGRVTTGGIDTLEEIASVDRTDAICS
jgi:hypothetical protein